MPIKFRCRHCRQFLGISRSKAGGVVDCPTCGRTIRVPNLDGTVPPIPEPKLDVEELAGALDELARIGEEGADEKSADESAPVNKPVMIKELAPLPRPEPITLEPPPPAEPIDLHAEQPAPHRRQEQDAGPMATLVPEKLPEPVAFPAVLKSFPVLGVLLASAFVTFVLGWIVGGMGSSDGTEQPNPSEDETGANAVVSNKPAPKLLPIYHPDQWKTAVEGQITFRTSDGRSRPDVGARVIVLPEQRDGHANLPVNGLKAPVPPIADVHVVAPVHLLVDDDLARSRRALALRNLKRPTDADRRIVLAGLRELGGNAAQTDQNGKFSIKLPPSSGAYHIIVISQNKGNDVDPTIPQSTLDILGKYFDRPQGLIGERAFKQTKLRIPGNAVETWNHSFD